MWKPIGRAIAALVVLISAHLAQTAADEMKRPTFPPNAKGEDPERDAGAISVTLDFARVMAFNRPARTIIIGNPGIIDATLSDDRTLVLTGRAVGATNMIILGDGGEEIANLAVNVVGNKSQLTIVHHGTEQQVFSCSSACRPVLAPEVKK